MKARLLVLLPLAACVLASPLPQTQPQAVAGRLRQARSEAPPPGAQPARDEAGSQAAGAAAQRRGFFSRLRSGKKKNEESVQEEEPAKVEEPFRTIEMPAWYEEFPLDDYTVLLYADQLNSAGKQAVDAAMRYLARGSKHAQLEYTAALHEFKQSLEDTGRDGTAAYRYAIESADKKGASWRAIDPERMVATPVFEYITKGFATDLIHAALKFKDTRKGADTARELIDFELPSISVETSED